MQNYYIRIEDMASLVSHQLSIIKYVVLKKIFFFLCFDRLIWTWTWTWTRTSLDSDSNLFGLGLDSDSNLFGLGLVLDSTKVDLTTALFIVLYAMGKGLVKLILCHKSICGFVEHVPETTSLLALKQNYCFAWDLTYDLRQNCNLLNRGEFPKSNYGRKFCRYQ